MLILCVGLFDNCDDVDFSFADYGIDWLQNLLR